MTAGPRRRRPRLTWPRTVRARTTVGVTALFAVVLVAAAWVLPGWVADTLTEALRDELQTASEELAAADPPATGPLPAVPGGGWFTLLDDDGSVLATTPGAPAADTPDALAATAEDDEGFLVVVTELPSRGGPLHVVAAGPLAEVERSVALLRRGLLVVVPTLVALIGVGTWLAVGRALRPVAAITERADTITGTTLAERVPVPAGDDEVAHLARTVNAMLARLERAAATQQRFAADASHELRGPLTAVRAELEATLAAGADGPGWEATARRVLAEAGHLERLVTDLLLLARLDGPDARDPVEVDLDDVARERITRARAGAPDGVAVDARAVRPAKVLGHPDRLAGAVRNLLDNALHHARRRVAVALAVEGGEAVLTVDDDGDGIPEADRDRVLEPFTRLDAARTRGAGGTGLGLALVDRVARAAGGRVVIGDAPLGGARVQLRLPAVPDDGDGPPTDSG